jgi:hypothetical protein
MEWKADVSRSLQRWGFDCVIGNPPWERLKLQEREFFSFFAKIASAVNAADRRKLIERVEKENPELWTRYHAAKGAAEKTLAHVRDAPIPIYWSRRREHLHALRRTLPPTGLARWTDRLLVSAASPPTTPLSTSSAI